MSGRTQEGWGGRRDLNPRLSVPQTDALPAELLPPPFDGPSLRYFFAMEKWRRKASRERGFCGPFGKKTVGPVATDYHEPKRPIGASNFYRRDCKRQAQTLTVRYAKLSPGLRTPHVPHLFSVAAGSGFPAARLAGFFAERLESAVDFRARRTPLRILQNLQGRE